MKPLFKYIFLLLPLLSVSLHAQVDEYKYRKKLTGISDNWHSIVLPNSIYSKLNEDLSDLRIFGTSEEGESIEVPYIFNENTTSWETDYVYSNIINETNIGNRYYYTFENESRDKTNSIELDFYKDNFDWKVRLEGSNNQQNWYTILRNERILALDNGAVDYKYTTLNFSTVRYKYFRLSFNSNIEPELSDVNLSKITKKVGTLQTHELKSVKVSENEDENITVIDIELKEMLPVSLVQIEVNDKFDYYRPIEIQRLVDSVETPNGWESY